MFQGASEDGSKVFFLSSQDLLKGAEGQNLYEYDFDAKKGMRMVLVAPTVSGVTRVSEDGSHVYFVARGVLTSENAEQRRPELGADNLYVYNTVTGGTAFVAELCSGHEESGEVSKVAQCPGEGSDAGDWSQRDERSADATPNGQFLVFTSSGDLTPGDTSSLPQVFEYDTRAQTLVQVSRAQGGPGGAFAASTVYPRYAGAANPAPQPNSVSDDGSYVAFQSESALVPQAIEGYENVYEYHDGRVSLISDGQDHSFGIGGSPTVSLVDMNGSGRDIFFTTADQLVPQDGDTQEDIYDARIGGGFLPAPPAVCEGEGCQGALASSQAFATAGSLGQPVGEQVVEAPLKPVAKAKAKRARKKASRKRKAKRAKAVRARRGVGRSAGGGGRR